jgi:hypothetical protein
LSKQELFLDENSCPLTTSVDESTDREDTEILMISFGGDERMRMGLV